MQDAQKGCPARPQAEQEPEAYPLGYVCVRIEEFGDAAKVWRCYAAIMQAPSGGDGGGGIARVARAAVLGLEQVGITTAGDIKGVAAGTKHAPLVAIEGQLAVANGAEQH